MTSTALPSGTDTTVADGYDDADNLSSVTMTKSGTPTTLADLTRDADEDITANSAGSGSSDDYDPLNQLTTAGGTSYSYDVADQLTSSESGGDTTDYVYDADGELCWTGSTSGSCSSPPGGAITYTYNNSGERTAETPSSGDPTTYGWDQSGSLICETVSNSSSYSCADPNSGVTSTYNYNGDGLRVSEVPAGGSTQNFTWNIQASTAQLLEDGTNFYLYGPNVGAAPIEQISISGSTPAYLVSDDTGVREQVSGTGGVDGTNAYDAYGSCGSCSVNSPYGYAGAYTDSTQLLYLINRYYDPTTGQFLSVDPLVALTQASYSYANGDPVNEDDPAGLGWGWNPISDISEAASDAGGAIASTVTHHWRGILAATAIVGGVVVVVGTGGSALLGEGLVATALDAAAGAGTVVTTAANAALCGTSTGSGQVIACAGVVVGIAAPYVNALGASDASFWFQGKYLWSAGLGGSGVVAGWATAVNAETVSKCQG